MFSRKKSSIASLTAAGVITAGLLTLTQPTYTAEASSEDVSRIEGSNRFETAANISQNSYDKADTIIIVNARGFADALAGAPLAYQKNAPILLAQGSSLHSATIDEINRLEATNAIILGGEAAVSEGIAKSLNNMGLNIERIAGDNRFDTAEKIADSLGELVQSDKAVVVDGFEFADAMSVAPFAAREGMPIYLTRTNSLTSEDALANFDQTYIIGGEHAVSQTVENRLNNSTRLAGSNRYSTNLIVLDYFGIDSDNLFISTGLDFVDALTGSVLAAQNNSGVALVRNGVSISLNEFITARDLSTTIFGGEAAVSQSIMRELGGENPNPIGTPNNPDPSEPVGPPPLPAPSTPSPADVPSGAVRTGEEPTGSTYSFSRSLPGGGDIDTVVVGYDTKRVLLAGTDDAGSSFIAFVSRANYGYFGDYPTITDESASLLRELGGQFLTAYGM